MKFTQPPVGQLESTKDLMLGDIVRGVGTICRVRSILSDDLLKVHEVEAAFSAACFSFVGRADADGWIDWHGGENPCPSRWVQVERRDYRPSTDLSDNYDWEWDSRVKKHDIVRFRIVEAPGQTDFLVDPDKVPDLRPEELRGNTVQVDVNDLRQVCHKLRLLASEWAGLAYSQRMALERLEASVGRLEASPDLPPSTEFQSRVADWMHRCFGADITNSAQERCWRFAEEAGELVQTLGMTQEQWNEIGTYVWKRPVGETPQEIGGVMVTLAALSHAVHLSMSGCGEVELARIDTPATIAKIRQKHHDKVLRIPTSPLPGADQ